jgi:hypothetical protein
VSATPRDRSTNACHLTSGICDQTDDNPLSRSSSPAPFPVEHKRQPTPPDRSPTRPAKPTLWTALVIRRNTNGVNSHTRHPGHACAPIATPTERNPCKGCAHQAPEQRATSTAKHPCLTAQRPQLQIPAHLNIPYAARERQVSAIPDFRGRYLTVRACRRAGASRPWDVPSSAGRRSSSRRSRPAARSLAGVARSAALRSWAQRQSTR